MEVYPGHQKSWAVFRWSETGEVEARNITIVERDLRHAPGRYTGRRKRYTTYQENWRARSEIGASPFINQETVRFLKADTEQEAMETWQESN